MKRDFDYLRDLLFELEKSPDWVFMFDEEDEDFDKRTYYLELLVDGGLAKEAGIGQYRLTSQGHDFIDVARNDSIWGKTKAGAEKAGSITLGILLDAMTGLAKDKLSDVLGISR